MGADFISFLAIGPVKLSASKATRKKAEKRVTEFVTEALRYMDAEIQEGDEGLAVMEEVRSNPMFTHLDLTYDIHWVKEFSANPLKLLENFLELWDGGSRDSDSRTIPRDKLRRKVVFAGEMSWGDEPDGHGYQTLKHSDAAGLFTVYGIE
jgi:hypothetical protein